MPNRQVLGWRSTQVQGRTARYLDVGSGPVLLFLHGWGLGYRSYRPGLARFASSGVRVLAPALPGFGGTAALPDDAFSLEGYAAWVADFLQSLAVEDEVVVAGHSFGGGVAIKLAHDWPDRVAQLVLINSIGGSAWARGSRLRSMTERPMWDWGLHSATDLLPHRQVTRVLPVILDGLVRNVVDNPRAVVRVAGLAAHADLSEALTDLRDRQLPIVILWGKEDQLIPPEAFASLQAVLSHAQVVTLPGGHNWLMSDPARFHEVMTNVVTFGGRGFGLDPTSEAG